MSTINFEMDRHLLPDCDQDEDQRTYRPKLSSTSGKDNHGKSFEANNIEAHFPEFQFNHHDHSSDRHKVCDSQNGVRKQLKSFIEFDDDDDEKNSVYDDKTRRRRTVNSSSEYGQELINVFNSENGGVEGGSENSLPYNLDEKEDDEEEWNQFQGSEYAVREIPVEDDEEILLDSQSDVLYGRLQEMEEEQELLNNSLLALTSHFAQVQLRLRQIVEAKDVSVERREALLKELENFANRGIPELMMGGGAGGCGSSTGLERSVSMTTSIMGDEVFEDDDPAIPETDEDKPKSECESVCSKRPTTAGSRHNSTSMIVTEEKLERQRSRQKELIGQLKDQLEDLERYAYETGELNSLPSSMLLERQNAIIEQLKSKLPVLSIDEIDKLSPEELRLKVDHAVKELVNPVIMKEQLVSQLKTQVTDLERFIHFLQQGGKQSKIKPTNKTSFSRMSQLLKLKKSSECEMNHMAYSNGVVTSEKQMPDGARSGGQRSRPERKNVKSANHRTAMDPQQNTDNAISIIRRILSLLHVFAWTQFGTCASFLKYTNTESNFEQNILKKTSSSCGRHWGDLRAQLEVAINEVLDFYKEKNLHYTDLNSEDGSEDFISLGDTAFVINNYFAYEQMTVLVRKHLSIALRNLIQHGLTGGNGSFDHHNSSLAPSNDAVGSLFGLGCFSTKSATPIIKSRPAHVWELILYYYEIKNGSKFRSTATRRLSQSFGLQVVTGNKTSPKQSLLAAIDDIIDSHTRLKRSFDSHFKAFVCLGLNQKMLSQWLRMILRNANVVNECYEKWSYTASTGFEDAIRQLDKLSSLNFCLPTDLAVRQLQSIHDAF